MVRQYVSGLNVVLTVPRLLSFFGVMMCIVDNAEVFLKMS